MQTYYVVLIWNHKEWPTWYLWLLHECLYLILMAIRTGIHTLQQKTITKHNAWVKYICTCSILWLSIQNIIFNIIFAYPCFFLSFSTVCSKNKKKKKKAEITQENWKNFVFSLSPPQKKKMEEQSSEHASCNVLVLPLHYRISFSHPVASRPANNKIFFKK